MLLFVMLYLLTRAFHFFFRRYVVEIISSINKWINSNIAWGPAMLVLIVGTGIYLSARCGFLQFRRFGYMWKNTIGSLGKQNKVTDKGAVSPFQALTTALAATVGTGNIAGVAGAIALGGPGAVFWMWVSALFGMVTKYSEVVLAVKYRERNDRGDWVGGPMYYITKGLGKGWKWLAVVFSLFGALAAFGIGNCTQVNTIAQSITGAIGTVTGSPLTGGSLSTANLIIGIAIAAIVALVIIGGLKRIGQVTEKLVPFMSGLYIIGALVIIFFNIGNIGSVFATIFEGAFNPQAVLGGIVGITILESMKRGVSRGVFSNEAGLGSAPMAHAAADTDSPVKQGLWGMFEVFVDTIVICTLTALSILMSGVINGVGFFWGGKYGADLATAAFAETYGSGIASVFVAVAILLFAGSTILSWSLYGTRCAEYLFGRKSRVPYQVLFVLFIIAGATMDLSLAWDIADTLNGLMAIPNLIALLGLSGVVIKATKDYFSERKLK